ncbi:hypothetical protein B0H12DRAFT_1037868 [Mycena haematopus]|nr:hypothetical protein B0H12DRAFT_1037868 [Mycena haematopus]
MRSLLLIPSLTIPLLVSADEAVPPNRCSSTNNHVDPTTTKFISDCSDQTFCSGTDIANSTCVPRQCRRDEFPFGFSAGDVLPPLCADGLFCPDAGSGCRPLVLAGHACELNRDEQCAPLGTQESFRPICLRSTCTYENATLGDPCISDNTTYVDAEQQTANTVTRDNCLSPQFYCNATALLCERTLPLGSSCVGDVECASFNCDAAGICTNPPGTPLRIPPWQCALTATAVLAAMLAFCTVLILTQKQRLLARSRELRDAYYRQIRLRRSIIALHIAAADRDRYVDEKVDG